jgi:hypothetical protein
MAESSRGSIRLQDAPGRLASRHRTTRSTSAARTTGAGARRTPLLPKPIERREAASLFPERLPARRQGEELTDGAARETRNVAGV